MCEVEPGLSSAVVTDPIRPVRVLSTGVLLPPVKPELAPEPLIFSISISGVPLLGGW